MKSHEPLPWLRARRSHLAHCSRVRDSSTGERARCASKEGVRNLGGGIEQLAVPAVRAQAQSRESLAAATARKHWRSRRPCSSMMQAACSRVFRRRKTPAAALVESLKGTPGRRVIASDLNYRKGVVEPGCQPLHW